MQLYDGGVTVPPGRPSHLPATKVTSVEFHVCKTVPEHPFGVKDYSGGMEQRHFLRDSLAIRVGFLVLVVIAVVIAAALDK